MRLINQFYIKNKDGKKVLFTHNKAQLHYEKHRTGRDIILKARQLGFTTYEQLRKLERILLKTNTTSVTLAHKFGKTKDIFKITQFAWTNLPEMYKSLYKIKYDSAKELFFENTSSRYFVDMDVRSGTVQDLHISEFAMVKDVNALFASSLEAVPKDGTITIETTANGLNDFHKLWEDSVVGNTEFTPHFYNWTWEDQYSLEPPKDDSWKHTYLDYANQYVLIPDIQERFKLTDSQFYWYFLKARRLKELIKQEYPTIPEEAFLTSSMSVFDLFKVNQLKAGEVINTIRGVLIFEEPIVGHRYILGCDTAEGVGGDNTSIEIWDFTDADNIKNVASFQDNTIRPDQVANVLMHLGKIYNDGFIIPERNGSGLTTVLKIQEKGYRNLFTNRQVDKRANKVLNEYGWRTTASNRDMMVDDFVEAFEQDILIINSPYLIQQMKTFIRKENGFREHDDGYHDDNLFASFLALQGNKFHRTAKVFTQKAKAFR